MEAPVAKQKEGARPSQDDDAPAHMQVDTLLYTLHAEPHGHKTRFLQSQKAPNTFC